MTDTAVDPGTWVPRLGDSRIPAEHAELIRGLYRLAAWVADHREIPAPEVHARFWPDPFVGEDVHCRVVDAVAAGFDTTPSTKPERDFTAYEVEVRLGPVTVDAYAVSPHRAGGRQAGGAR